MQIDSVAASAGSATWRAPLRIATRICFSFATVAVDVLDLDGGVVDEHPDDEREPSQRHEIESLPGQLEADDPDQDGQRDRDGHDERASPAAHEREHHERDERRRDGPLAEDARDRRADEPGLVECHLELHALRGDGLEARQHVAGRVDHGQRGRILFLENGEVRRALSVDPGHVRLQGKPVVAVGHVSQEHGGSVGRGDGELVEVVGGRRAAVDEYVVRPVAEPGRACGQDHVLGEHGVDDRLRRDAVRLRAGLVDVDDDLPLLAAIGRRGRQAGHGEETYAKEVEPPVEELLLGGGARQRELGDGHVRGVVLEHHGRLDARRHEARGRQRRGDHLRYRAPEVGVLLEVDAEHRGAVDRLRIDPRDAADRGRHRALAEERHPTLHVLGGEPRIVPNDDHDRDVDGGEDVDRHRAGGERAKKQHHEAERRDGERTAQGESDDPHGEFLRSGSRQKGGPRRVSALAMPVEPRERPPASAGPPMPRAVRRSAHERTHVGASLATLSPGATRGLRLAMLACGARHDRDRRHRTS